MKYHNLYSKNTNLQKPDSLSAFSRTLSLIIQLCKCGCRTHPWCSPFPSSLPYIQPINKSFQCFHLHFWIYSFAISPATSISEAITISHWTATVVCLLLSDPFEAHIWFNLFNDFSLLREWHGIPQVSTDSAWLCCSLPSSAPFLPMVLSAQLWGIAFWLFSNSLWPLPI